VADPTGLGYTPWNIGLSTEQADIDRKRQIMQALLMQSMQQQPTQMAGNIAIRQGPLSAIARVLTGAIASKGIQNLSDDEKSLVQRTQEQSAQSVKELMKASQYQQGTPSVINEEAGPPTADGTPSMSVQKGTPGGFDQDAFSTAYAKAQGKVDPKLLADALQQFNRNRMLVSMGYGDGVPGYSQGNAQPTVGTNSQGGFSITAPSAPAAPQQGGGGIPGVPRQAAALMASGDPGLEKIGQAAFEASKPTAGRAGAGMWGYKPDGSYGVIGFNPKTDTGQTIDAQGNIVTNPGYLKSARDIITNTTTAENTAKAPFQNITVNIDGREVPAYFDPETHQVVLRTKQGQAPAAQPQQPAQAPAPAAPPLAAPPAASMPTPAPAAPVNQFGQRPGDEASDAAMNAQVAPLTPAQRQLAIRDQMASAAPPSIPGATNANGFGLTPAEKAESEGVVGNAIKQAEANDEAAKTATQGRATIASMKEALQAFNPGAGADLRMKLASFAAAGGLPDNVVNGIAGGDLNSMQVFTKEALTNATTQIRSLLGPGQRITQMEMLTNYTKGSSNPNLLKTANEVMLDVQDGTYRWLQDKQAYQQDWQKAKGTNVGFDAWWNRNRPLSGKDEAGNRYVPTIEQVRQRMDTAERAKAGPAQPATPPSAMKIASDSDYNALPSGSLFVGPDGKTRRKP
jgi:hypothetical protein